MSPGFFALLGVEAQLGRTFLPESDATTEPTVILSHGLWQRRFGSDPAIVGQTMTLDDAPHTVVGVVPPQSYYHEGVELWIRAPRGIPAPRMFEGVFDQDFLTARNSPYLWVVGRLAAGVTLEQAQAEMETIAGRLADAYPDANAERGARAIPLQQQVAGGFERNLTVLLGTAAFVLLMACANIASLALARGAARERELAIRATLGAGRGRLTRQLLTEGALLTLLGAGAGVMLAPWGLDLLLAVVPEGVPRQQDVAVDRWVLTFALAISLVTMLVVGLMPALHASRTDVRQGLGTRATGGRSRQRLQRALVVAETAVALVLLVGAGLLARSFVELRRIEPGFDSDGVLVLSLTMPAWRYPEQSQLTTLHRQLLERVGGLPDVRSAATSSHVPLSDFGANTDFAIEGRPPALPGAELRINLRAVGPGYFRTLGIPLLSGRDFTASDGADVPVVAINEAARRRYWPDEDPLGQRLVTKSLALGEIVAVVGDAKQHALREDLEPELYVPPSMIPFRILDLVVKTDGDPLRLAGPVREAIQGIDPQLSIQEIAPLDQIVGRALTSPRFNMLLIGLFAAIALVLATVGIFSVMTYSVSQRTRDIGIRLALGARAPDVYTLVVRHGAMLTLLGVVIGGAAALALTRVLADLLYGVTAFDPLTFAGVAAPLAAVDVGASYLPARRAAAVDPLEAIRAE